MRAGWSIKRRVRMAEPYTLRVSKYAAALRVYRQEVWIDSIADAYLASQHGWWAENKHLYIGDFK